MLLDLIIRFLLGGAIVSLFAAIGEACEPKTLAGIFGAAPSVALATLALAFAKENGDYVAIEGRSLVAGAGALFVYSVACVAIAEKKRVPVAIGAAAAWVLWLVTAFGLWRLGIAGGAS